MTQTERWALIKFNAVSAPDSWEPPWSALLEPIDKALDDVDVQFEYTHNDHSHHLTHGVPVILDYDPTAKEGKADGW
jgi:hypothetical protein